MRNIQSPIKIIPNIISEPGRVFLIFQRSPMYYAIEFQYFITDYCPIIIFLCDSNLKDLICLSRTEMFVASSRIEFKDNGVKIKT